MNDYVPIIMEDAPGKFRVWSEAKSLNPGQRERYVGPVAQIYGDADWIHVETDAYEGNAMLNRETLPVLIQALQRLAEHLNIKPHEATP